MIWAVSVTRFRQITPFHCADFSAPCRQTVSPPSAMPLSQAAPPDGVACRAVTDCRSCRRFFTHACRHAIRFHATPPRFVACCRVSILPASFDVFQACRHAACSPCRQPRRNERRSDADLRPPEAVPLKRYRQPPFVRFAAPTVARADAFTPGRRAHTAAPCRDSSGLPVINNIGHSDRIFHIFSAVALVPPVSPIFFAIADYSLLIQSHVPIAAGR